MPYLAAGLLLVLGCGGGGVVLARHASRGVEVLALRHAVPVGHVLAAGDVRTVSLVPGSGIHAIKAQDLARVAGSALAYALPAGTVLTRADLGAPKVPPAGSGVVAVGVDAARVPARLAAGDRVLVVAAPAASATGSSSGGAARSWSGTVVAVSGGGAAGSDRVVSVELSRSDARAVAGTDPDRLSVVVVGGSG